MNPHSMACFCFLAWFLLWEQLSRQHKVVLLIVWHQKCNAALVLTRSVVPPRSCSCVPSTASLPPNPAPNTLARADKKKRNICINSCSCTGAAQKGFTISLEWSALAACSYTAHTSIVRVGSGCVPLRFLIQELLLTAQTWKGFVMFWSVMVEVLYSGPECQWRLSGDVCTGSDKQWITGIRHK